MCKLYDNAPFKKGKRRFFVACLYREFPEDRSQGLAHARALSGSFNAELVI